MKKLNEEMIQQYKKHLTLEEKAEATIKRYVHDVVELYNWIQETYGSKNVSKETLIDYKRNLQAKLAPSSVNTKLSSINSFFAFLGWDDLKTKLLKIQKQIFLPEEKQLTRCEYERLIFAAEKLGDKRLSLLMQTVCSTGIRISELKYVTVESLQNGYFKIDNKGKLRFAFMPTKLCKTLGNYCESLKILEGPIFVSRSRNALDRSNVWLKMKKLCDLAGVPESKIYPHNLRHLFARTYYSKFRDIVRLADVLGHSSINTTRVYTMEPGDIHREQIEGLGLVKG